MTETPTPSPNRDLPPDDPKRMKPATPPPPPPVSWDAVEADIVAQVKSCAALFQSCYGFSPDTRPIEMAVSQARFDWLVGCGAITADGKLTEKCNAALHQSITRVVVFPNLGWEPFGELNPAYQSSVMRCNVGDDDCPVCRFLGDIRDAETMLAVIQRLDSKLAEQEAHASNLTLALTAAYQAASGTEDLDRLLAGAKRLADFENCVTCVDETCDRCKLIKEMAQFLESFKTPVNADSEKI